MPEKKSISAAIFSSDRQKVLAILRAPDQDDGLAGLWGLPAVTLKSFETNKEAIARIGWQKLGVKVTPIQPLGSKVGHRSEGLLLTMHLWECTITEEPDFSRRDMTDTKVSQYTNWKWTEPHALIPTAQKGSLCTQLLLESQIIIYEG